MTFFSLYTKTCNLSHKISHLPFITILPQKFFFTILPTKFIIFFLLVSPLEMVSPAPSSPASRRHWDHI